MQMQPDFEKANEIYFRLGIIYKQQSKFGQSLEVCRGHHLCNISSLTNLFLVLQIHCVFASAAIDRGGYMVPDWTRP